MTGRSLCLALLMGCCISVAQCETVAQFEDLTSLTDDTFDDAISKGAVFAMFYAPWCGHCTKLKPTWVELANQDKSSDISIVTVDCTVETKLCSDEGIKGYPTLLLYTSSGESQRERFTGARTLERLTEFIAEHEVGAQAQDFSDIIDDGVLTLDDSNFDKIVAKGDVFVKFFIPGCGFCKNMKPAWHALGNRYLADTRVHIAMIDCGESSKSCKRFEIRGFPTMLYLRDGEVQHKYEGDRSESKLAEFVEQQLDVTADKHEGATPDKPLDLSEIIDDGVLTLDDSNFDKIVAKGDAFVKFFIPGCGFCKNMKPAWHALGNRYLADTRVHIAMMDCGQGSKICRRFEVQGFPTMLYLRDGEVQHDYEGERSEAKLAEFVEQQLDTQVAEDALLELTTDSFDEALQETGLKFIKFFAPWCGHCKNLAPTWHELAEHFHQDDTVQIAHVDCTQHEPICKAQEITSYPTLRLFLNGTPITDYKEGRSLEELKSFVMKNKNKPKDEL